MDNIKSEIINYLLRVGQVNKSIDLSFNLFAKELGVGKKILDSALKELENERYITQFILPDSDDFKININDSCLTYS